MWFDRIATFLSPRLAYEPSCAREYSSSGGKIRLYLLDPVHVHSVDFQNGVGSLSVPFACGTNGTEPVSARAYESAYRDEAFLRARTL